MDREEAPERSCPCQVGSWLRLCFPGTGSTDIGSEFARRFDAEQAADEWASVVEYGEVRTEPPAWLAAVACVSGSDEGGP